MLKLDTHHIYGAIYPQGIQNGIQIQPRNRLQTTICPRMNVFHTSYTNWAQFALHLHHNCKTPRVRTKREKTNEF